MAQKKDRTPQRPAKKKAADRAAKRRQARKDARSPKVKNRKAVSVGRKVIDVADLTDEQLDKVTKDLKSAAFDMDQEVKLLNHRRKAVYEKVAEVERETNHRKMRKERQKREASA